MAQTLTPTADEPWMIEGAAALPRGSLRRLAMGSALTVFVGLGGLVAWASVAQVESAVPATGVFVAGGKRKTISLVDSGILRELPVREGDKVAAGQVLLRLDDVQVRAQRAGAFVQYWSAAARLARLNAEAADSRDLPVAPALAQAAAGDPAVAAAVAAEAVQFRNRWAAVDASVRVQERKVAQQQAAIAALRAQIDAAATRRALILEELRGVDFLMARGLSTKPRQLELRRTDADLYGVIGQAQAQLAQAMQAIAQIELETANAAETRRADIARERSETGAAQADAEQRLLAANDLLAKREIPAPEAGTVTDIRFFTPGSSINAGQPVMDLVPDSSGLLLEAQVAPHDVEHLELGQHVNVRLSAYKSHRVPVVTGRLTYVGADRQMDATGQPFFLVRATVDADSLRDKPGVVLLPGMPADVLIVNKARTVLDFLVSPITDSMRRSLREE